MAKWFVEYSDSVKTNRTRIRLRDFVALPEPEGQRYVTWIKQNEEGNYSCDHVLFDFDSDGSPDGLQAAQRNGRSVMIQLANAFDVPYSAMFAVCSTAKGFHIYLDARTIGIEPCADLHEKLKKFCLKIHTQVDPSLYSKNRIVGVPNSKHRLTRLYYTYLSAEEFLRLPVSKCLEMARRKHFVPARGTFKEVPKLKKFFESVTTKEPEPIMPSRSTLQAMVQDERAAFRGVSKGGRNEAMFKLAGAYRRMGLNIYEVATLIGYANQRNEPPLSASSLTTMVNSCFKGSGESL